MKKNIFEVSQEERYRILEMHENRTSNLYLMNEQESQPNSNCTSENINITNEFKIRLTGNQSFGEKKFAEPKTLLNNFYSVGGSSPIIIVKRPKGDGSFTSTVQKNGKPDNIWLSKIEYVQIIDTKTKKSIYFPSFITLTHMFCATFSKAEIKGGKPSENFVLSSSADKGSEVYNYYRIPVVFEKGSITIDAILTNGLNVNGLLYGVLDQTFAKSNLGNIPQKIFGENFSDDKFPNPQCREKIINLMISNQPK